MKASTRLRMNVRVCAMLGALYAAPGASAQQAPPSSVVQQSLTDAWWTGPMLAPSAATLPPGHVLIEPYVYDVSAPHASTFGSRSYIIYGLRNRLSVGAIPIVGYTRMNAGPSSSSLELGDFTLLAQYRLTQFHRG